MAIVFNSTIGDLSANSYTAVARADELLPILVDASRVATWVALDNASKELYLMRAVRLLEAYMRWEGMKQNSDQPIGWPRYDVYGPDRYYAYLSNVIPQPVQEGQSILALCLAEGFDQNDAAASPVDRVKVSSIQVWFASERSARSAILLPSEVVEKFRGYGDYVGASGMAQSVTMERG